jgi:hypothetical protein
VVDINKLNSYQFPARQHSAAEVDEMSDEQSAALRHAGGVYQRGAPESAMNRAQAALGGGVYSHALEHVGDLTHRMNELAGRFGTEYVSPKIRSTEGSLNHPYGFEREMRENVTSNAQFGRSTDTRGYGQAYADEHRKVPVYNYPSEVARDAAVSLGEHRFDDTRRHLGELGAMDRGEKGPSGQGWAEGDLGGLLKHSKEGMVDYLRDKESRSPHITNAARVMLGGPRGSA